MKRLLSLDFTRGLIMVLLMLESAGLYGHLLKASDNRIWQAIFIQFDHHPWHGLRFWDLIQPGFMFMAGVAMAYSLKKQEETGMSWSQSFRKILRRSAWLFFWGVLDYAVRPQGLSFELWDVLTQLSFTTLVAFLLFRYSFTTQILASVGILLLTEALYRFTNVPSFDQAFVDQHNFGNYMDLLLMNKINKGGWVAINCIPTAVHTIAGAMVGKIFMTEKNPFRYLLPAVLACWLMGYGLDLLQITPIIKRIATSSFTLASLGWVLGLLCLAYYWIDTRQHQQGLKFFTIVGMNSLFIYLFFEIVGHRWFNGYIGQISDGIFSIVTQSENTLGIIKALVIFGLEWGLCYFLYKKNLFFRV